MQEAIVIDLVHLGKSNNYYNTCKTFQKLINKIRGNGLKTYTFANIMFQNFETKENAFKAGFSIAMSGLF